MSVIHHNQLTVCLTKGKYVLFGATKFTVSVHVYFVKINKFNTEIYMSYQKFQTAPCITLRHA